MNARYESERTPPRRGIGFLQPCGKQSMARAHQDRKRENEMTTLRPILLVEDNLQDLELATAALEENKVANPIVVARHGVEAMDYLLRRGKFKDSGPGKTAGGCLF